MASPAPAKLTKEQSKVLRTIKSHARRRRLMARWGLPIGLALGFLTGWMDWF